MSDETTVRIDKWLWAARFFKTRALAVEAIKGGHIHLDGTRVKPARGVRVGDHLSIRKGPYEFVVSVRGLSERRGPAAEAQHLYEETAESAAARERLAEERRLRLGSAPGPQRRPDKRSRRQIRRFIKKSD
jgi:ribosome-associated heat shock protein Hsp15